jgi:5-methylcytosine-specific restriction enzyme A
MRHEFSKRTKLIAWNRSQGRCEACGVKLFTGRIEYHHDKECTFGGSAELENCIVLCRSCHEIITGKRAAVIAKSSRIRGKHIGIKKPRSIRAWRKFDGSPVYATRER